ncbi:MAG: hypothetical protein AB1898_16780 [Acidobacteriota bacterium]
MNRLFRGVFGFALIGSMTVLLVPSRALAADSHVISPSELHQNLATASKSRQSHLRQVREFFGSTNARTALSKAGIDSTKVNRAIPLLSDQELARLASQTQGIQQDVAAGALTNEQITYIIIALATAVVILVIIAA